MIFLKSLFRTRRKGESLLKYILFLTHLWGGMLTGLVIVFVALTGALYVFKAEVEELSAYSARHRSAAATREVPVETLLANFEARYAKTASQITFPENRKHNVRLTSAGRGTEQVVAFADRETGEMLGEVSPAVSGFFFTVMRLHRWLGLTEKRDLGRQLVAGSTVVFLVLLLSGLVLWMPRRNAKKPWRNKFNLSFGMGFKVLNRDLHINLGMYTTVLLALVAWTGIYFTYPSVREFTLNRFRTEAEKVAAAEQQKQMAERSGQFGPPAAPGNPREQQPQGAREQPRPEGRRGQGGEQQPGGQPADRAESGARARSAEPAVNYDTLLETARQQLDYPGDLSLIFPGRRNPELTVRRANNHNWAGAALYDDVLFAADGKLIGTQRFADRSSADQARSLVRSVHTGEILGLKGKILAFVLALFAAWLPVSGYLMWWQRACAKARVAAQPKPGATQA